MKVSVRGSLWASLRFGGRSLKGIGKKSKWKKKTEKLFRSITLAEFEPNSLVLFGDTS